MSRNPYIMTFGKIPEQAIPRIVQTQNVLDTFSSESPTQQVFMITGVRGAGKTVFMTDISEKLGEKEGWIVAELNPERDLLNSLASKLSSEDSFAQLFQNAKINLSFFGFGLEVKNVAPITDIETALQKMLENLGKNRKRVLITIDEVTSTPEMRAFAATFQIFVRKNLPVYLLMTGLYENINSLQNEKSLTFLYRAPKIELQPLNIGAIARNYESNLQLDSEKALEMAKMTKGYPYAFQLLGYLTWEMKEDLDKDKTEDKIIGEFRQMLDDLVYDKVWSELSGKECRICYGIANCPSGKIVEIRSFLNLTTNQFNPYRKRLIKKGILDGERYGYVYFKLPFFSDYVRENAEDIEQISYF